MIPYPFNYSLLTWGFFSQMLIRVERVGEIRGATNVTKGPSIYHLLFAYDSFVSCKARSDEVRRVKDIIKDDSMYDVRPNS